MKFVDLYYVFLNLKYFIHRNASKNQSTNNLKLNIYKMALIAMKKLIFLINITILKRNCFNSTINIRNVYLLLLLRTYVFLLRVIR
jgi:hypothetical protein